MALLCDTKTATGDIPISAAYHRVAHVANSRLRNDSIVIVEVFSSANAPQSFKLDTYYFPYDKDLTVEMAYNLLKTLPVFSGAQDV